MEGASGPGSFETSTIGGGYIRGFCCVMFTGKISGLIVYTHRIFAISLIFLAASNIVEAQVTSAATFGTVISLQGGTPSDMVLDEVRHRLYLVSSAGNRVDIFNTDSQTVVGGIAVGKAPLAAALSMDGAYLYVTNSGSSTLSVISMGAPGGPQVSQTVAMPAVPEGVEVGSDGRALVSTQGTTNTLIIFDQTQTAANQLTVVSTPPPPSTPAPLPAQTLTRPQTTFNSKLIRTPDGNLIVGLTNPGNNGSQTYVFVYEVASGTILRSRTTAGQSTILSMAPDGSRFMAGYTLYDTATLSVIAQENNANAPFPFTAAFSTQQNVGGSVFTPDGNTIYAAFNVATFTANPPPKPLSSTLLVNDSHNLGISLGIRLPESIVSKMVITSDGTNAWSLSASGLIYLPLSTIYNYPILMPETTQVFLSMDPCNRGVATGALKVNNIGKGRMTYSVANTNASVATEVSSGLAPSTIKFTMDPGRTGVVRQSGTNLSTGAQSLVGNSLDLAISSNEAINIPNTVRVYMNQRDPDQRGIVHPIPVAPNNSPATTANETYTGGNEGLQDILLDQARNRIYITNSAYNRVEIFDTVNKVFLNPFTVGQLPHAMAMSSDGSTLYVGNTGGELISIVDLTQDPPAMTGYVNMPPIPRQGGGTNTAILNPRALAYGVFGLEFVMSNGTQWKLTTNNQAVPRPLDSVTKASSTATSNALTAPVTMLASSDALKIITLGGNYIAYLYDAATDSYVEGQNLTSTNTSTTAIQGYFGPVAAAPGGAYYLVNGMVLDPSLSALFGASVASSTQRNVAALAPLDTTNYVRFSTSFRANVSSSPSDEIRPTLELVNAQNGQANLLGVIAEQPRYSVFGTTRTNISARSMVVDSSTNTAYILTLSGLTEVPLTLTGTTPPQLAASRPVINSNDGTATNLRPGAFVTISGSSLAFAATAATLPAPTVLGGSCVTFNDVALPLFKTAGGQIQAQIPSNVVTGTNVVVVRSLATGTASDPVMVTVLPGSN